MAARAVQQNTTATRDRRVITIALHFRLAVVSGFRRTVHDVHLKADTTYTWELL
jgi:hypothetical protein